MVAHQVIQLEHFKMRASRMQFMLSKDFESFLEKSPCEFPTGCRQKQMHDTS